MEERNNRLDERMCHVLRYSMCKHMRKYLAESCVEHVIGSVFEDLEPYITSDKALWLAMRSALPRTDEPLIPIHSFALPSRTETRLANIDAHLSAHAPDYTYRFPDSTEATHQPDTQTVSQSARQVD